jgi:hypothetical protein
MSVTISGTTGVATPGLQNSANETIAGTLTVGSTLAVTGATTVDTIKSTSATTPTVFQNSAGVEIGTLCRAWASFNGTASASPVINAAVNVDSVVRTGTGRYVITFTSPLSSANYAVSAMGYNTNIDSELFAHVINQTASSVTIQFSNAADGRLDSGVYTSVMIVG